MYMYTIYFSVLVLIAAVSSIWLNICHRKEYDSKYLSMLSSWANENYNETDKAKPLQDCAKTILHLNFSFNIALFIASTGICILSIINLISDFVYGYEFFISAVIFIVAFIAILLFIGISLDYYRKKFSMLHEDIIGI